MTSVLLAGVHAEHYFDVETGYGKWIPRWGGNDGPDDAAENGLNWTVLYTLGASPIILELWKRGYEGHIKQYTEAKTVEVPMAREGMYYRDFSVMFDFFHHTESLSAFTLSGLADPLDTKYAERTQRFAAMYMGDDPEAPNYDNKHKLIRSIFTGSRGPMLRKATGLDWAGDPLTYADGKPTDIEEMVREGRGGLALLHGEHSYQQMIEHFEECVAGACPAIILVLSVLGVQPSTPYEPFSVAKTVAWQVQRCCRGLSTEPLRDISDLQRFLPYPGREIPVRAHVQVAHNTTLARQPRTRVPRASNFRLVAQFSQ